MRGVGQAGSALRTLAIAVACIVGLFLSCSIAAGLLDVRESVRASVQNFKIEGRAMAPTYRDGDYVVVSKQRRKPARFDLIVFRYPKDESRDFLKRVIGLPGETVEVRGGAVYVDGRALDEPYVNEPAAYTQPPVMIPAGQYYVLGDNRNNSSDSHVWGLVPERNIVGTVWLKYWPL